MIRLGAYRLQSTLPVDLSWPGLSQGFSQSSSSSRPALSQGFSESSSWSTWQALSQGFSQSCCFPASKMISTNDNLKHHGHLHKLDQLEHLHLDCLTILTILVYWPSKQSWPSRKYWPPRRSLSQVGIAASGYGGQFDGCGKFSISLKMLIII